MTTQGPRPKDSDFIQNDLSQQQQDDSPAFDFGDIDFSEMTNADTYSDVKEVLGIEQIQATITPESKEVSKITGIADQILYNPPNEKTEIKVLQNKWVSADNLNKKILNNIKLVDSPQAIQNVQANMTTQPCCPIGVITTKGNNFIIEVNEKITSEIKQKLKNGQAIPIDLTKGAFIVDDKIISKLGINPRNITLSVNPNASEDFKRKFNETDFSNFFFVRADNFIWLQIINTISSNNSNKNALDNKDESNDSENKSHLNTPSNTPSKNESLKEKENVENMKQQKKLEQEITKKQSENYDINDALIIASTKQKHNQEERTKHKRKKDEIEIDKMEERDRVKSQKIQTQSLSDETLSRSIAKQNESKNSDI